MTICADCKHVRKPDPLWALVCIPRSLEWRCAQNPAEKTDPVYGVIECQSYCADKNDGNCPEYKPKLWTRLRSPFKRGAACTRADHHDGPCNGLPRENCAGGGK